MSDAPLPEVRAFLGSFFASPNKLKPDSKPELAHWVGRLNGSSPQTTVLPCWRQGSDVDWYGLAFDDRGLRALGESLTAFVGPSHTTFRGRVAELDPADPIDAAIASLTGGRAFKFRGREPAAIWRALDRMRNVWARRGNRGTQTAAPVGRVLREFHMALQAADRDAAVDGLLRLRSEYHIEGVNLLFLRVQMLESLRSWRELLSIRELPDLLRLRRPRAVTEAVVRAVYHESLSSFEFPPNPAGACAAFRNAVYPKYASLFATTAGMHSPEAAKTWALLAVTSAPPDVPACDTLLARKDLSASDLAFIGALRDAAGPAPTPAPPADPFDAAAEFAARGDFDRAFRLASEASPSPGRARLLCECAVELDALDARAAAVAAVNGLSDAERTAFLGRRLNQRLWDTLRGGTPDGDGVAEVDPPPADWCGWLERLDSQDGQGDVRDLARRGATEWEVASFIDADGAAERFIGLLQKNRSQSAENALRDCLPYLVGFFGRDKSWPNPRLAGAYRALMELLFYSTNGGRPDLVVFNDFLDALLTLGPTAAEYRDLASYCGQLWSRFAAPSTADWATEALDLLAAQACPDAPARAEFFQSVFDRAAAFNRHLSPEQRELLRLAAADLGAAVAAEGYFPDDQAEQGDEPDTLAAIASASVAAYTLSERAAARFKRVLEARAPGVSVTLMHDLDGSKRLQQHARQADVFVMVASSATHAATDCIQANRPHAKPLLIPAGKGAASMLAAVRAYCEGMG